MANNSYTFCVRREARRLSPGGMWSPRRRLQAVLDSRLTVCSHAVCMSVCVCVCVGVCRYVVGSPRLTRPGPARLGSDRLGGGRGLNGSVARAAAVGRLGPEQAGERRAPIAPCRQVDCGTGRRRWWRSYVCPPPPVG